MHAFTPFRRHLLSALMLATGALSLPAHAHPEDDHGPRGGLVFTSSNAPAGNELLVYAADSSGTLSLKSRLATGGLGSGAGLGSQGAVTLSGDGRYLFVVNAGSNSISTFAVGATRLTLTSTVDSGGLHPISVTEHDGLVYVLNDGGSGNVVGLRNQHGQLRSVPGAQAALSAAGGTGPAQVGFSDDGDALVVTEKATHQLLSFAVRGDGRLGPAQLTASPGRTPFGFAFNRRNRLVVSEAAGGAAGASTVSSYRFSEAAPGKPQVVSAAVPDFQGAACWVAITPSGRYAYVANAGSSDLSSYRIHGNGAIELMQAQAGATGDGSAPADTAVSLDGRRLYVRNGRVATLSAFEIGAEGQLNALPGASGLPSTAVGLASN